MSIETIKTLAIGFISPPTRSSINEAMLALAVPSALALYSTLHPVLTGTGFSAAGGQLGNDEKGSYVEVTIPLTTGIMFATSLNTNGEHYAHRIAYTTTTDAGVRIYGLPNPSVGLIIEIYGPVAHSPTAVTWPAHHEALIALMAASFYLNALAVQCADANLSDSLQNIAASYYGRASTILGQIT